MKILRLPCEGIVVFILSLLLDLKKILGFFSLEKCHPFGDENAKSQIKVGLLFSVFYHFLLLKKPSFLLILFGKFFLILFVCLLALLLVYCH